MAISTIPLGVRGEEKIFEGFYICEAKKVCVSGYMTF